MKNILLAAAILMTATPTFAADTYTIDPNHTAVEWSLSHFGFSNPSGKFYAKEGTLVLDQANPEKSRIEVSFIINDMVTGIPKLDEHLKGADFFDTAKFPTATFKSTKIVRTGDTTAEVTGDLTLHGVTKPVTLRMILNKIGDNMMKLKTAGFSGITTVKRSDFGMNSFLPGLGDEVSLVIESEATLADVQTH